VRAARVGQHRPVIADALLDALAVLLPVDCAGCGAPDRALCGTCRAALIPEVSSRPLAPGLRVWSGLEYDGVARQAVLALKRDHRVGVAGALAPALAAAIEAAAAAHAAGVRIAGVPGTRAAYRRRGFDPVRVVLGRAGVRAERLFAPARAHPAQKLLGVAEREANLRGAFRVRSPVSGSRILLVDDVVTTGATLRAAAQALERAGASVVGAAVIASTPRRFGDSAGLLSPGS
jgi:ComF family protein